MIEQKYVNGFLDSKPTGKDVREQAYLMLHILKEFKFYLTNILNTGKMATVTQEQRMDAEEREIQLKEWDGSPDGRA